MSIASELGRLQQAKLDLETSIEAKGVNVPAGTTLDDYPALVDTISSVLTGDAAVGDVLASKTFYSNNPASKLTGTMVDRGTVSTEIDAVATEVTIAAGKHSGTGVVKIAAADQAKLIAENIKSGVTVLGVAGNVIIGTNTSDATADAHDIYDGKTAYINGVKVTGDMYGYGGVTPGEVPSDWPDIHAIVAADVQAGYAYKYIYLLADDYTYSNFTVTATDLAFKTSDGDFYTSTTTHNWDLAQDISTTIYKVRWVIVYSNTEPLTVALPYEVLWLDGYTTKMGNSGYPGKRRLRAIDGTFQTGFTYAEYMFSNCYSLTRVPDILDLSSCGTTSSMFVGCFSLIRVPDILDLSSCGNTSSMFNYCYSLTRVPDILDLSSCENTSYMFNYCYSLTRVPDILDLSSCGDTSYMFNYCSSLTRVPDILDLSSCSTTSSMFNYCYSLTRVPDILDLSSCENTSYMFNYCYSLTRVPDILDLSSCTSTSSMFSYCYSLTRVPEMTIATASAALVAAFFQQSTRVNSDYKGTVATFDGGGAVNGGMVYYLPTVTITRKLTLNSTIKGLFTGAEQTAIASNLTGKNWSIVW